VCVRERESERERGKDKQRETERERRGEAERQRERDREREREREKVRPAVGPSNGLFVGWSAEPLDNPARPHWPLPTVHATQAQDQSETITSQSRPY